MMIFLVGKWYCESIDSFIEIREMAEGNWIFQANLTYSKYDKINRKYIDPEGYYAGQYLRENLFALDDTFGEKLFIKVIHDNHVQFINKKKDEILDFYTFEWLELKEPETYKIFKLDQDNLLLKRYPKIDGDIIRKLKKGEKLKLILNIRKAERNDA